MVEDINGKAQGQWDKGTIYEVSYLLLPSISAEQVGSRVDALKKAITSQDGELISDEDPVLIDLAYAMTKVVGTTRHKCDSGYFGWVKFEMPQENIEAVKKSLDANDEVLRYLIIKTVRENTLVSGKMKLQRETKPVGETPIVGDEEIPADIDVVEPAKDLVVDEIDTKIDDLVIA